MISLPEFSSNTNSIWPVIVVFLNSSGIMWTEIQSEISVFKFLRRRLDCASTSFPGSLILPPPGALASGGGKMRDPGNEVDGASESQHLFACLFFFVAKLSYHRIKDLLTTALFSFQFRKFIYFLFCPKLCHCFSPFVSPLI